MFAESTLIAFLASVDTTGGRDACWPWQGPLDADGYGKFHPADRVVRAHRAMLEIVGRPMPDDMVTDHLCRNRRCVNPRHLEIVTVAVNNERAVNRAADGARARKEGLCVRGHVLAEVGEYVTTSKSTGKERRACKPCQRQLASEYQLRRRRRDYEGATA